MAELVDINKTDICFILTDSIDGDLGHSSGQKGLEARKKLTGSPWLTANQVHGGEIYSVDPILLPPLPINPVDLKSADGIVCGEFTHPIAVFGADCGILGFASREGIFGVAHCGWRGLVSNIVGNLADSMRQLGATDIYGVIGYSIGRCCYEFSSDDLKRIEIQINAKVGGLTDQGKISLDLKKAIEIQMSRAHVDIVYKSDRCTACDQDLFSWRRDRASERQAIVGFLKS
ncbi:MAG: polyphenol oxidase family protein [Acidimicrobiales bacterium]|nr:polyphenol oxidase family protein [Acidimicrobiales bacterium]